MPWLYFTILSYFFYSIVNLIDRYIVSGPIPNPKVYTFYIGLAGIFTLLLIPFVNFVIPDLITFILSFLTGIVFIFSVLSYLYAIHLFDASRIVPAIGGFLPLLTFGLVYIFSFGKEILSIREMISFGLLVLGSVLIVMEREIYLTFESLKVSFVAALLGALYAVLLKYVYLSLPFWSGLIWIVIGGIFGALLFIFSKEVRKEIFGKKVIFNKKTISFFFLGRAVGATGNILQNFAIALVPLTYVAIVNALSGIQYFFLFIFTILISLKFPNILKEEISKRIILQKIFSILLITTGLTLISLK